MHVHSQDSSLGLKGITKQGVPLHKVRIMCSLSVSEHHVTSDVTESSGRGAEPKAEHRTQEMEFPWP